MRTRSVCTCVLSIVGFFLSLTANSNSVAGELYFIDAHSQIDQNIENLDLIIQRMDAAGVYRTILDARSGRKQGEIASFAQKHSQRIIPAVRTKSGAYNKNHPKYYKKMRKQIESERFKAMVEILLSNCPYKSCHYQSFKATVGEHV